MVNLVTLTNPSINSGVAVNLSCTNVSYGWKNMVATSPSNSAFGNVEAQKSGWENPIMNLTFIIDVDNISSGFINWSLWNQFLKNQYDGTINTRTILNIVVGKSDTSFFSYAGNSSSIGSSDIGIEFLGSQLSFSPGDSDKASFWSIKAQIQETK